jgi:hypothetical protein
VTHGCLDGGRLGVGNLGLPTPSMASAESMDASAGAALIGEADQ